MYRPPLFGIDIDDPKKRVETIFAEAGRHKEPSNPLTPLMPLVTDTVVLGSPIGIQMLSLFYRRSNLANVLPPVVNASISNVSRRNSLSTQMTLSG